MPDEQTDEWTYVGRRTGNGGKTLYTFHTSSGDPKYYAKPLFAYASVGSVYRMTFDDSGVYVSGDKGPVYLRRSSEPDTVVAEWRGRDLAIGQDKDRRSAITKASRVSPLEDILKPLRDASLNLTPSERRALAVEVLSALRL